jgi:hypothetical protein
VVNNISRPLEPVALKHHSWFLMLAQLALSAVLTALGSTSLKNGTPITVIAAINTSIAGILALMHNSGLPDRYRSDRNEFCKVEEYLKEVRSVPDFARSPNVFKDGSLTIRHIDY